MGIAKGVWTYSVVCYWHIIDMIDATPEDGTCYSF